MSDILTGIGSLVMGIMISIPFIVEEIKKE